MSAILLQLVCLGLAFHGHEAQPTFTPIVETIAENVASVSGTLTGSGGTGSLTYVLKSQPATNWFALTTAGVFSLAAGKTVDFETTATYAVVVTITDSADPPVAVDITYTYTITDVNEAPTFATDASAVNFQTAPVAGDTITTLLGTDPESATVTHSVSDATNYAIDASGVITVKTGAALSDSTAMVSVYAADASTPPLTGTHYLFVCIGSTCSMGSMGSMGSTITGSAVVAIGALSALLMRLS